MTDAERNEIVEANTPLALSVARAAWRVPFVRRIGSPADCRQEAKVGLLKAAEKFDQSRGFKFSTFAVKVIWNHLMTVAANVGVVRVPRHVFERNRQECPSRLQAHRAKHVRRLPRRWAGPSCEAEPAPELNGVARALERLQHREREVVARRFGLDGHQRQILSEVGKVMGVTKERVRQIEVRALARLRGILQED